MQFEGFGNWRRILCNNAYHCIYNNLKGIGEKDGDPPPSDFSVQAPIFET